MKSNTAIICLSPNSGGMEIDSLKLSKKLGQHVKIFLISKKNTFISSEAKDIENITSKQVNFKRSLSVSLIKQLRKIIIRNKIKNIIFFGASELKSLYFALLGLNVNLIIRHGTTKTTPKKDWFHRLIYKDVNYHIAISKHIENNVRKIIPLAAKAKLKVIYPSVYFTKSIQAKLCDDKIKLIHTGRIIEEKGQVDAIKACKILYNNNINFNFTILGNFDSSKYKNYFLKFLNKLPYKQNIELLDFTNDVQKQLSTKNIFLFPSYGEGFGNSFAEALSIGLVCICYDNTSLKEFKKLGFYMHIVKNKDIEKLKEKILYISKNIFFEKKAANQNISLAKKIFSEKKEIKAYLRILK